MYDLVIGFICFGFGVVIGTVEGPAIWAWVVTPSPAKVLANAKATILAAETAAAALAKAHAVVAAAPVVVVPPVAPAA